VGKLNARRGAIPLQEIGDAPQGFYLCVIPKAKIGIGDAALGRDRRGLDDDEAETADGEAPEMHEVPVIGQAMARRILAHRRHDGAVLEGEAAKRRGREKPGHQLSMSLMR